MRSSLFFLPLLLLLASCNTAVQDAPPVSTGSTEIKTLSPVGTGVVEVKITPEQQERNNNEILLQEAYDLLRKNPDFLLLEEEYNQKMGAGDQAGMEAVRVKMKAYYTDSTKTIQADLKLQ